MLQKQGMIKCFEYTFELAWKTLQDFLIEVRGYGDAKGPRPVLEQAFQDGIIADGMTCFDMLKSRNLTAHLYDEKEADVVFSKITKTYLPLFLSLRSFFEKQP